jgi:hypothetical protein
MNTARKQIEETALMKKSILFLVALICFCNSPTVPKPYIPKIPGFSVVTIVLPASDTFCNFSMKKSAGILERILVCCQGNPSQATIDSICYWANPNFTPIDDSLERLKWWTTPTEYTFLDTFHTDTISDTSELYKTANCECMVTQSHKIYYDTLIITKDTVWEPK